MLNSSVFPQSTTPNAPASRPTSAGRKVLALGLTFGLAALSLAPLTASLGLSQAYAAPVIDTQLAEDTLTSALQSFASKNDLSDTLRYDVEKSKLIALYKARDYRPVWLPERRWSPKVKDLMTAIALSKREGLNPAHYDVSALTAALPESDEAIAEADYRLTAAYMSLTRDFEEGRYNFRYTINLADLASEGLEQDDLLAWLDDRLPKSKYYRDLRRALKQYQDIVAHGDFPEIDDSEVLKPGMEHPNVAALRDKLILMGDLRTANPLEQMEKDENLSAVELENALSPGAGSRSATRQALKDAVATSDDESGLQARDGEVQALNGQELASNPNFFDDTLADAVKHFQLRHNLSADAVVGPNTYKHLNTSAEYRVLQIKANMERLRWEFDPEGDRYIRVNMGEYTLRAYQDGKEALVMPVVIGKEKRPTPVIADKVVTLKFRPDWTVPKTIFAQDYLPNMVANPYYPVNKGLEMSYNGKPIDPATAARRGLLPHVTLRQPPGDRGALGGVRFSLTNDLSIYLHDTPSKSLFSHPTRAYSSGCVRVGRPAELAEFILGPQGNWPMNKIRDYMSQGDTRYVKVDDPVPVFLSYITVWVDDDGTLRFQDDFYRYDNELILNFL